MAIETVCSLIHTLVCVYYMGHLC